MSKCMKNAYQPPCLYLTLLILDQKPLDQITWEPRACPIQDKRWMVACRRMDGQVDDFILRQLTF